MTYIAIHSKCSIKINIPPILVITFILFTSYIDLRS